MSLESNELLSNAASVAAAGETLGLSPDEAFAVRGQTLREAQRRQRAERNLREGNREEALAFLAKDERDFRAKGQLRRADTRVSNVRVDEDYPDPFGGQEQRIYRDDGSLQEVRDLIADEQTLDYEERVARGLQDGDFGGDSADLRQERGLNVLLDRGTPAERRKWREGRYVTPAGKRGASDRANRPARPALFNAPEHALGRRRPDLANPALRQLEVVDPRSRAQRASDAIKENADRRGEARKAQEGVSRSELEARIARQAREIEDLARGVEYYPPEIDESKAKLIPVEGRKAPGLPEPARFQVVDPQQARLEAERSQRTGVNLDAARWNAAKAAIEADQIARTKFGVNGPGSMADDVIGRIGEIRKIGIAGKVGHGPDGPQEGNFQVVLPGSEAAIGDASPLMRNGIIDSYYGVEDGNLVQLGEINTPDSANALNAPTPTRVQSFAAANLPDYAKPGGLTFAYPEVNVTAALGQFGERMRSIPNLGTELFPNPTNLPELEAAVESIIARQKQQGDPFFKFSADLGKAVPVDDPGIEEVLYKMRYSDGEVQELANALYQSDMARLSPINQERKADLAAGLSPRQTPASDVKVRFGSEIAGAEPELMRFKGEKVKVGKKRQGVGAAIRAIDGNEPRGVRKALEELNQVTAPAFKDAPKGAVDSEGRKVKFVPDEGRRVVLPNAARDIAAADAARGPAKFPFQAALASEEVPRANFIRGNQRGRGEASLIRQFGPENGRIAAEIEQRYLADEAAKSRPPAPDAFAEEQRAMDRRFREEGYGVEYEIDQIERAKLYELMTRGAAQGGGRPELGARSPKELMPRIIPAGEVGRKLVVPPDSEFFNGRLPISLTRGNPLDTVRRRGDRQDAVMQSAAPTPTPERGSWMGGSPAGARVVSPWGGAPQPIQSAAVPQSIAPDPGAATGPASNPVNDAIRKAVAQRALPPGRSSRPLTPELREELFALPNRSGDAGRSRMNENTNTQDFFVDPDGPGAEPSFRRKRQAYEAGQEKKKTLGRRVGYGVGGTAALAGILGLSNMGNEEEEQMR